MASSRRPAFGRSLSPKRPQMASTGWRTRDILRTLAIIAGFYITLQVLWIGRSIVLLTFLGVLFGIALAAGVDRLERRRVPRGVGAVLLVLAFLGTLVGIGAATAPSITGQIDELKTQLPEAIGKIQRWVKDRQAGVNEVLEQVAPDSAAGDKKPAASDTTSPAAGQKPEGEGDGKAAFGRRGDRRPARRCRPPPVWILLLHAGGTRWHAADPLRGHLRRGRCPDLPGRPDAPLPPPGQAAGPRGAQRHRGDAPALAADPVHQHGAGGLADRSGPPGPGHQGRDRAGHHRRHPGVRPHRRADHRGGARHSHGFSRRTGEGALRDPGLRRDSAGGKQPAVIPC